ncbi:siderophore esteras-like protein IroE-like protein [Cucurbitaria berberidis CBS 394.84]|uniref:Siderophore esteras-like protein IroE-like protein n=1 Tax=Cucurbitaria berberidis CBS 394.84 TaxID=1168544 RepID=A0A9P4L8D6_9PLEO|nr:siderophore esteras-like protein IroE-like protein [Cucurbitaria berberidis CBS 394.84]KAF1845976.1 siderophore esteras-like protein IroE-like protein [Cucurbitaria berberidis CBS 394.84]
MSSLALGAWQFTPLVTQFPTNVLPNTGFWKATNGSWEYQIQLAWPLNWTTRAESTTVETMYVLDGNALGLTATEAFRRRRPVEFNQPDSIVVSIGYPETIPDSPYSTHRSYDFQPPVCSTCPPAPQPGVPSNADNFIHFIDTVLRPWVKKSAFPNAAFDRDALYGHSFGGLFVLYALVARPELFDTYLCASPALFWNNDYVFNNTDFLKPLSNKPPKKKPAFQISYGAQEQYPVKRRTETAAQFAFRQSILVPQRMTDLSKKLYNKLKGSPVLRDVSIHEYPFSGHAAVGAAALADGIDYFLDW